jgi:phosphatidate phosphatase APP1
MSRKKIPVLLSFYALSNGKEALIYGQVATTRLSDLSFTAYSRRRTFRTLFALYRTHPAAHLPITLHFGSVEISAKTDATGAFFFKHPIERVLGTLQRVAQEGGRDVTLLEGLYLRTVHHVSSPMVVVSDIDDTLLHSFIRNKFRKLRTLLFTPVEKRGAVKNMRALLSDAVQQGGAVFYLSNSEQNLYPLIYRFLLHNKFPAGPLFLKQLRKLRDVFLLRKIGAPGIHKLKMLDQILALFPDKQFALVGDNTQLDLSIYLAASEKYPDNIRYILIRKVRQSRAAQALVEKAKTRLQEQLITLYYDENLPSSLHW